MKSFVPLHLETGEEIPVPLKACSRDPLKWWEAGGAINYGASLADWIDALATKAFLVV